jgi:hypothetical protein
MSVRVALAQFSGHIDKNVSPSGTLGYELP